MSDRLLRLIRFRPSKRLRLQALGAVLGGWVLGGCNAGPVETHAAVARDAGGMSAETSEDERMWMSIGERRFAITLADTDAARAFAARLPLTLDMAELNGNEKHGDVSEALPANASRPGTLRNGDLMLYGSKTVVIFYETFRSPYSYTRLGHVDDPDDLARTVGRRNVRVVFSVD